MNVFSLFENAVAAWGDRTAVRCGARRQTYRELDAKTNQLAHHLRLIAVRVLCGFRDKPGLPARLRLEFATLFLLDVLTNQFAQQLA